MKKFIFCLFLTLNYYVLFGSDPNYGPMINTPSPSVFTFNTYGSIPVSLYTGTLDLTVPIYEIKQNNISIPIDIRYNINNVKPNIHPGEVGLGWNLFAGGCITRIQNGVNDEYSYGDWGYMWSFNKLSDSGSASGVWYSEANVDKIGLAIGLGLMEGRYIDCGPDEFRFNFLGYSGSLYLDHEGKWVVDSDTRFIVEDVYIQQYKDLRDQITKGMGKQIRQNLHSSFLPENILSITGFKLRSPDGVAYTFGQDLNAIEYSIDYITQQNAVNLPISTTWHLTRIDDQNDKILFIYDVTDPLIQGSFDFWIESMFLFPTSGRGYNFTLALPVLLKQIKWNDYNVGFKYKQSTQLEYEPEYSANWQGGNNLVGPVRLHLENNNYSNSDRIFKYAFINNYNDIKWNQLDQIIVPGNILYQFEYTSNNQERLKLLGIKRMSQRTLETAEKYNFIYNDVKLPKYLKGHYDHLGFYNGKDFSFMFSDSFYVSATSAENANVKRYTESRSGDATGKFTSAEMLKEIHYPTGGYSEFVYEPHRVNEMVGETRTTLVSPSTTTPGGLRIKKIINYSDGKFVNSKSYYYTTNFSIDNRNDISSGILSFTPKYFWDVRLREFFSKSPSFHNVHIFTSDAQSGVSYNINPGVEYSQVIEAVEDINGNMEGYVKYCFNSYFRRNNILLSFDVPPIRTINTDLITPKVPFGSNSRMRDKIARIEIYDIKDSLKKRTEYEYSQTTMTELRNMKLWVTPSSDGSDNPDSYMKRYLLGGSFRQNLYSYLVSSKREIEYSENGSTVKNTEYGYNIDNQIAMERTSLSGSDEYIQTNYIYTGDLLREAYIIGLQQNRVPELMGSYYNMFKNYMYTYPIEIVTIKNGKTIAGNVLGYSANTYGVYYLSDHYKLCTNSPINDYKSAELFSRDSRCEKYQTIESYDPFGKPSSIDTRGSKCAYFWSYGGIYPVMVVNGVGMKEILNAKITSESFIDNLSKNSSPENELNTLRAEIYRVLPECLIATYKYKPLIGLTSVTDPSERSTYFDYDVFGRLKSVRDDKGLINSYEYNFKE